MRAMNKSKTTWNNGFRPVGLRRRRGGVLIYITVALPALIALVSLGVDLGRVQLIKAELQRCADASARGHLALYSAYGMAAAQAQGPKLIKANPVDAGSKIDPTVLVEWGWWDPNNLAFKLTSGGAYWPRSVRVTTSRSKANRNPVPLMFASVVGFSGIDLTTQAVATLNNPTSVAHTVSSQYDPWLAGAPDGTKASYNDVAPYQSPSQVAIPLTPNTYITFNDVAGKMTHYKTGTQFGPDGDANRSYWTHGADSPGGPTPAAENGIADAKMPICAMLGVFLDDSNPSKSAAPERRDYQSPESRNKTLYDDIKLKQPFFIGDGLTSGKEIQKFKVPAGATRLYICVMDGYEWKNNTGGFTTTVKLVDRITLVK